VRHQICACSRPASQQTVLSSVSVLQIIMEKPAMSLRAADEAPMQSPGDDSVPKGLAPPTPPQLSPVKPRRPSVADAAMPPQSDLTALTAELRKLVDSTERASALGDRPADHVAVDWEHLPLDVWDVVWRGLDLTAQMALCLTSTRCAPWASFCNPQGTRAHSSMRPRKSSCSFALAYASAQHLLETEEALHQVPQCA